MTHILHPEIQAAINNMMKEIYEDAEDDENVSFEDIVFSHLGPYLHMPQTIENEPLDVSKYQHSGIGEVISVKVEPTKDNEPLPDCPQCKGFGTRTIEHIPECSEDRQTTCVPCDVCGGNNTREEEQKQSTPIENEEVVKLYNEYSKGYSAGLQRARDVLDDMLS